MQEIYKRALLLIHNIEVFGDDGNGGGGIAIYFNSIKKKFFGSGYKVVGASGQLCLSLDYVEGDLCLNNIDYFGSQKAYYVTDESFLQRYLLDAFGIAKILSVAKNSEYATGQIKDDLNRLVREFTDGALRARR